MNLKERDTHLDKKLGIIDPNKKEDNAIEEVSSSEITTLDPSNGNIIQQKLQENVKKLNDIHDTMAEVLESGKDNATSFGKASDYEAVSKVADSMINIQKEIRETIKLQYASELNKSDKDVNANIVFNGNFRDLIETLKDDKTEKVVDIQDGK
jgi:hypothetical protein